MKLIRKFATVAPVAAIAASLAMASTAGAAIEPTRTGGTLAEAIVAADDQAALTGAELTVAPPNGDPAATADTELALFPLNGPRYTILSTGNTADVPAGNNSGSTSTDNGGDGGGHGTAANDAVTLRLDLQVPADSNCLTIDYRFLTEEFPEFVGSEFNDTFLAEIDANDFEVSESGTVTAPSNFAIGPDGEPTTVNAAGTSADNALGTTYDGATPVLRATTPVTPGAHSIFLTIYDAGDHVYDSSVFIDNLRLRNVSGNQCKRGAGPNGKENGSCQGQDPNIIVSGGGATGTKGDDVILGSGSDDVIRGRGGDDIICGAGGDDEIRGNAGDDDIRGNAGDDLIYGNGGADEIRGLRDEDEIHGQSGDDEIRGGNNDDLLFGGVGEDRIAGNRGDDVVRGRVGDDSLQGNKDNDRLGGGKGRDECRGGTGTDVRSGCEAQPR